MKKPNCIKKIEKMNPGRDTLTEREIEEMQMWIELKWYRDALETIKSSPKSSWDKIIQKALSREDL